MYDAHTKEEASIALVEKNVDDANMFVTNIEKGSDRGIFEKAQWMNQLLGQD